MRTLVTDLTAPLVDKVCSNKDVLSQLIKQTDDNYRRVGDLEKTVFESGAKMDVFEKIYDKIARVEGDRKTVEQRLEANDAQIMRTFEEHKFRYENNEKQMNTLVSYN